MSEARKVQLALHLENVLQDGEAYLVQSQQGKIEVWYAWQMPCRERYPQLYGSLLRLDERVRCQDVAAVF
jgi:hypothetical protein